MSEKDEGVEEVQSSSYKMNKKQGHDVHHGEYGQNYSNKLYRDRWSLDLVFLECIKISN